MAKVSARRKSSLVILIGFAGAVFMAYRAQGSPSVATHVAGSAAPKPAAASTNAAPAPSSGKPAQVASRPAPKKTLDLSGPLLGDAALRGHIDLDKAELVDGRYQVALPGGRAAVLTLDPKLQQAAESVLVRAKAPMGAIVVTGVDGRILALAGRRNEEPVRERDFSLPLEVWAPAASIFKIVTAAALIDKGVKPSTKVCYHGGFRSVVASNLTDDPRRDKACQDLTYAMAESQNAIMAKLAHKHLEPGHLHEIATRFGFDSKPEFALPGDNGRCDIPKDPLEFARVSAGFWKTELSPLGGAVVANTVASGGKTVTPWIVEKVVRGDEVIATVACPEGKRVFSEKVARQLTDMMVAATERGTAYKGFHDKRGRKFLKDVKVAGKTGTLTRAEPSYLQYSWFVGFAPADAPQVSISVLLGNPPKWHLKAHTAARLVLESIF